VAGDRRPVAPVVLISHDCVCTEKRVRGIPTHRKMAERIARFRLNDCHCVDLPF